MNIKRLVMLFAQDSRMLSWQNLTNRTTSNKENKWTGRSLRGHGSPR